MLVKLELYIGTAATKVEALTKASARIAAVDAASEAYLNNAVVTKLYAFFPSIDQLFVLVTDSDRKLIRVESPVLVDSLISAFDRSRVPSQFFNSKTYYLKSDSTHSLAEFETLARADYKSDSSKINFINLHNLSNDTINNISLNGINFN